MDTGVPEYCLKCHFQGQLFPNRGKNGHSTLYRIREIPDCCSSNTLWVNFRPIVANVYQKTGKKNILAYTLVKKQRKLRQSAFRIAPQQAQANLCEPSDLARTDWLELMAVIFARVGVNLKRIPKSTQIPCVSPLLHILVR